MARKKKVHVEMSPATKFSTDLMKLAERINKYLNPKYDSANVRGYLNDARSQITMAATTVGQLAETWKPGRAKKPLSAEQLKKLEAKAAKLAEQIAEAKAAQE